MSFQILQRAYAPYGTAAQFPASGDSRLIYRATDTGYLYTWDASESAYKLAGIDPATAPYLGLHAQADDAARLGGQLPSYFSPASHTHTFASLTSKPTTLAGYGITDAATAGHTHSGYETAIGNPSADGYLLSSTAGGVRSWVVPYSHPPTHAQSVIDSAAGWITEALNGKQAAGNYLTTTGTAADSAKLGGIASGGYSVAGHTHNYETALGNPGANGYILASTAAGSRSWVAPYSHPATHSQSVIESSSGWITTALAGKQNKGDAVNVNVSGGPCAVFESSAADAQFRLKCTAVGGGMYSFGSGGSAAGAGAGFYIYHEGGLGVVLKIDAVTGQPRLPYVGSVAGPVVSDAFGSLSTRAGLYTGTKIIGGVTLTFEHGLLVS